MLCYITHVMLCYVRGRVIKHILCYITNDMLYHTCYVI